MESPTVLLDTNIIVEYFRKQNKSKSILYRLSRNCSFCMSSINAFELKIGLKTETQWHDYYVLTEKIEILPIDEPCIDEAVKIFHHLKSQNKLIELADLLTGATAISNSLPLATLNTKHFENIPDLSLFSIS